MTLRPAQLFFATASLAMAMIALSCSSSVEIVAEQPTTASDQATDSTFGPLTTSVANEEATPVPTSVTPTPTAAQPVEPDPTSEALEPVAVDLSARARFDAIVLDAHAQSGSTSPIATFHEGARARCGSSLALPNRSESDSAIYATETDAHCQLLTEHNESSPTGLTVWEEIVDARWSSVVWWEDRASFQNELELMCQASSALDLRLAGFSVSANDQYLATRYSGECRHFVAPAGGDDDERAFTLSDPATEGLFGSIFLRHQGQMTVVDAATLEEKTVVAFPGRTYGEALSPSGDLLVFATEDDDDMAWLWLVDIAAGTCRSIASEDGGFGSLLWSPDSDRLIAMPFDRSTWDVRVEVISLDGSRRILVDGARIGRLANGGWLGESQVVIGANNLGPGIWWQLWDVDSGEGTVVGFGELGTQGAVSADGTTLAFGAKDELHIVRNLDDKAPAPWDADPRLDWEDSTESLPDESGGNRGLTISPDNSWLLYASTTGSTPTGAFAVNLQNETVINLAPAELLSAGEAHRGVGKWSPDSRAAIVGLSPGDSVGDLTNSVFTLDGARVDLGVGGYAFAWTEETVRAVEPAACQWPNGS